MEQNIAVVPELQTYNFLQNSILWLSIITHYLLILHLPKTSAYNVSSLKLRHAMNLGNLRATSVKYSYVAKICPDCIDGKITFFGNQKGAPDGVSRDAGLDLFCLRDSGLITKFRGIRELD